MADAILRLDADDVLRTLETLDPVAVLAEELIKRAINHPDRGRDRGCRLVPREGPADDVLLEYPARHLSATMPAATLRAVHTAALAALATRELLAPGGITVAMVGVRERIQSQLFVLVKHVPDIVHVAVLITDRTDTEPLEPRLIDQLDLSGIGLSEMTALAETLFGANLVVVVSEDALTESGEHASVRHLVRGTVLVNASGQDLPVDVIDHVDQIYVDDLDLLSANEDRQIVREHLEHAAAGAIACGQDRPPAIAGGLGLLLAGARPGREQQTDIVVVELLSAHDPDTHLAHLIAETAAQRGLGRQVTA